MVKVRINGRLEAAQKIIMEIPSFIMEKSWNNHGILILNFCGNPADSVIIIIISNSVLLIDLAK